MYISGPSTGLLETLEYQQNNFSPHFCSATIIKFSSNGTLVGCHIENHFFIPKTFCLRIRQIAFYRKKKYVWQPPSLPLEPNWKIVPEKNAD